MKMTTEQFLSQLGIEVGKTEFMCSEFHLGKKYRIIREQLKIEGYNRITDEWEYNDFSISDLLDAEITPLPKYTLSEDEKAIVRLLPIDYKYMYRYDTGLIKVSSHSHKIEYSTHFSELQAFSHLFEFIGEREEVSIDELRKCL